MSSTVIAQTNPVARKEHYCDLCNRVIDAGETYTRTRAVGDDGPYVWKQCSHCTALLLIYGDDIIWDRWEGYCDEDVRQWEPTGDAEQVLKARWLQHWRDVDGTLVPVPVKPGAP